MIELSPQKKEKLRSELPIEQQANCKENSSIVMFSRMQNPIIKKQIIDLFCESQDEYHKVHSGFIPMSRKAVEDAFDEKLKQSQSVTPISYEDSAPYEIDQEEVLPLGWTIGKNKEKPTIKQWEVAEAHEKGHSLRPLWGTKNIRKQFNNAFDKKAVIAPSVKNENDSDYSSEDALIRDLDLQAYDKFLEYLFDPDEIIERMSQLKNYFGMKGSELFTKEHLSYARNHYIKDTESDNNMTEFFQAITPEKEDAFIELINSAGI